ncbi:MAG TPA: hypothetical protein VNL77_06220 [Roseiflexaceae bacterium]|nr:hypothetical protein [Roseiflexaceae bacterium]
MPQDSYDILRRALIEALGPKPTPERRRQLAAELRSLAEQQERMAASAERRPADAPAASGRTPGMYIRIGREPDPQTGVMRVRLSLGRQVWIELGTPERVEAQRTGPRVWIVASAGAGGYPVSTAGSLPSCIVRSDDPLADMTPGRYAVAMLAGAAVVGERVG